MKQPMEFVSQDRRKPVLLVFLVLMLVLLAVFAALDEPIRTAAAPQGIVSFELAGTVEKAGEIVASWAGFRYLLVHVFGGLLFFTGMMLYYGKTGSFAFNSIAPAGAGIAEYLILCGFALNAA